MQLKIAKPTGLCFGVKRAIAKVEEHLAQGKTVWGLGSPIHNPQEVKRLEALGLKVVADEKEIPPEASVFIRAHGVAPSVIKWLESINAHIIDGTCPFVRQAQEKAAELTDNGYHLLVVGDANHPEIVGIVGYAKEGKWTVISHSTDLENVDIIGGIGIISQTTQQESTLAQIVADLIPRSKELRVYNTICRATIERQMAVASLAKEVDGIILIGGRNSANTAKLYRIAIESGCDVHWIEHSGELDQNWLKTRNTIGIAAGASTPDWLIEQLINAIQKES